MLVLWGCVGLVLGSFATCLIYRLPRGLPWVKGRSQCPACEVVLRPKELVPVVSWVLQRGRCAHCGASVSPSYPVIEVGCGVMVAAIAAVAPDPVTAGLWALLGVMLVMIAWIDARHQIIPDVLSLGVAVLAMVAVWRGAIGPVDALLGAVAGLALLGGLRAYWLRRREVEGIGVGDLKLIAGLGAWTGLEGVFVLIAGAGILAIAIEVGMRGRRTGDQIPLGAYLCVAMGPVAALALI